MCVRPIDIVAVILYAYTCITVNFVIFFNYLCDSVLLSYMFRLSSCLHYKYVHATIIYVIVICVTV